jgi:hypothetical protein
MSQASFYRIGAVAMIVGTVFALVFNVVHGRASDATNTEAQLPVSILATVWLLAMGVLLWRRAEKLPT